MKSNSPCSLQGITFTSQAQIDSFHVMYPECDVILGDLIITGDSITNLNGFLGLKEIYSTLYIHNAGQLTSLSGLDSLNYINRIYITNTPITSLNGLGKVEEVTTEVTFNQLQNLTSLAGFGSYPCEVGYLNILDCNRLTTLEGLNAIADIRFLFSVEENDSLLNLTGLNNLQHMGSVEIVNNPHLTTIALNEGVMVDLSKLVIIGNSSLSTCNEPFVCSFLSAPTGFIKIGGNAPGCDRPATIARICGFTMPCLTNGMYYLTSQAAVDSFALDYPGCKDLKGSVILKVLISRIFQVCWELNLIPVWFRSLIPT